MTHLVKMKKAPTAIFIDFTSHLMASDHWCGLAPLYMVPCENKKRRIIMLEYIKQEANMTTTEYGAV